MKVGEKIILKNLGECVVMAESNDIVFVSKDGVAYFVNNPNKKRQDEEYSFDSVRMFGFTVSEIFATAEPLYREVIDTISKQYKIDNNLSQIVIDALTK